MAVPEVAELESQIELSGSAFFLAKNEYVRWFDILMNTYGRS